MRFFAEIPPEILGEIRLRRLRTGNPPPEAIVLDFLQGFWASGRTGEGDGGGNRRGRIPRGAGLGRHCGKRFPPHCENRFPLSRDARGKTVNEKPARGPPHDNRPRRVGCAFCAKSITNEQNRSQMSMVLCAKCAGKPRKAGRNPPEIAGAGAETGENAQEWAETGKGGRGEKKGGRGKKRTPRE